ncbi:GNAT family N-acetyltransferase [Paludibaculum fermentans]|uniref:GNAT family N-acetyltransferase n=1 Tax=Paludibaculum fermentans TaxID=1473598 RepID=UPI003EBE86FA
MDPITIRLAEPADAEFLVRGNASMALETEHLSLDLDRLRDGVHALFEDTSRGVYYVAEVKGRRVGQMMITYEWSDWRNGMFWWIQSVWVEPEFRGRGVFKALYAHVEQLARGDAGVCGLRLYVEQDNERAQGTYVRCGMKRTAYQMFEADFVLNRTE